jgi:hypothetical protein
MITPKKNSATDSRADLMPTNSAPPLQVYCPHCRQLTNHIQTYDIPVVLFALIYVAWSWDPQKVFGCPPCARQQLRLRAVMSTLMANLLCFIPLSIIIRNLMLSYADTRPTIPVEYEYLVRLGPAEVVDQKQEAAARRKRLFIILIILAIVGACLVFLLPELTDGQDPRQEKVPVGPIPMWK